MKHRIWRIGGWALMLAGWIGAARAQEQSGNRYYVDGLLVDQYKQPAEERGQGSSAGLGGLSLRGPEEAPKPPRPSAAVGAPLAPSPSANQVLESIRAANTFAEKKEWGKALQEIQNGLAVEPSNPMLLQRGAALAAMAGNNTLADQFFGKLLDANPDSVTFLTGRAAVQIRMRQVESAQALNERALALQPGNLLARFNRALILMMRGDGLAGENWNDLMTSDVVQVANWLDADREIYTTLLSEDRFAQLADALLGQGMGAKVPDLLDALRRLGQAQRIQEWDKALSIVEELEGMGLRKLGVEMDRAHALMEQGQREQALEVMKSLNERYSGHYMIQYNLAFVLIEGGQYTDALALLEQAIMKAPMHPQIRFARACMLAEAGRLDEAWPMLVLLMREFPAETRKWLQGEDTYLVKIKKDPRFPELLSTRAARAP